MIKTNNAIWIQVLWTILVLGCIKPIDDKPIISNPLIGTYLAGNKNEFSSFYEILEKSGTLSFLSTYGTYTCFAPTNAAIEK